MDQFIQRILDLAIAIQQIPAPTFHEAERAEFVCARFAEEGLQGVEIDSVGNVYACFNSDRRLPAVKGQPLIVSAHLDTVFPLNIDLSIKREQERLLAPGIGDNSMGVAGLIGLVWALRQRSLSLPGDLWLVGNVCEEGLGNLRGMQAIVDRFEPHRKHSSRRPGPSHTRSVSKQSRAGTGISLPRAGTGTIPPRAGTGTTPLAYIIVEGTALGQIYQRGLGVRRYRLQVQTAGGHSWIDYGQPSAVHELTALSTSITALKLPREPRTTLNVGIISGGSSVNTIAAEAMLELDLRSENTETLEDVVRQVEQIVSAPQKPGVAVKLELIGKRPAGEIPAEHQLVKLAQNCLREVGVEPRLNIGSTDANLPLSLGLPSITIGLTTGGRAHTVHEFMNIAPLEKGMEQLVKLVSRAWD
jgi:tripeptide aminopeptidase